MTLNNIKFIEKFVSRPPCPLPSTGRIIVSIFLSEVILKMFFIVNDIAHKSVEIPLSGDLVVTADTATVVKLSKGAGKSIVEPNSNSFSLIGLHSR